MEKISLKKEKRRFRKTGLLKSKVAKIKNFRPKSLHMGGTYAAGPT